MKKRLASMLLVICCLLSMVGCGGEPTEPVENNGGSSAPVQADAVEDSNAEVTPSLDDVDLSPYFDEETSELIKAFPGVSSLNLSTTIYDEEYDHRPDAVLFLGLDSILPDTETGNFLADTWNEAWDEAQGDYTKMIDLGGCIEIYQDENTAKGRDSYLTGYYLFGLNGGECKSNF